MSPVWLLGSSTIPGPVWAWVLFSPILACGSLWDQAVSSHMCWWISTLGCVCSSRLWHLSWNLQLLHLPWLLAPPQFRQSLGCHVRAPSLCCAQDTVHGSELKQSEGSPLTSHLSGIRPPLLTSGFLQTMVFVYVVWVFSFSWMFQVGGWSSPLVTPPWRQRKSQSLLFTAFVHFPYPRSSLGAPPVDFKSSAVYSSVSASSGVEFWFLPVSLSFWQPSLWTPFYFLELSAGA